MATLTLPGPDFMGRWLRPLAYLGRNAVTLTGAVLTTSAGLTLVGTWLLEMTGKRITHPYAGIVFFFALPAVFVAGLVLMPIGALVRRARLRGRGELPAEYPRLDFADPVLRKALVLVAGATFLNVGILGTASYRGMGYMDSTTFCGQTCHTVMAPEYAAYRDSPHSRVACVECHIGEGATWFVKSKLSGTRQVFAVALNDFSRPVPSPVHHLRPARETCEECHWPDKFHGEKVVTRTRFEDDEANTPRTTVLLMKIGGRSARGQLGIHGRHLDPARPIEYDTADDKRQVITRIRQADQDGRLQEYAADAVPPAGGKGAGERRTMDCMDCHNRPTHAFELPERAVDRALAEGRISRQLPYIKKMAVQALRAATAGEREAASRGIADSLTAFYRDQHPEVLRVRRDEMMAAVAETQAIYLRNVFPEMRVTWGTYPNNIGHEDFLGCFRCHDDQHKRADGRTVTQDCEACHSIVAQDEADPEPLKRLGLGAAR
ncbi:MAG TPA: NapC/NirT family cytochrome c [Vicinamibacteria bacterium]|nr:NapC/NirT family cytochrome c [Vicinamibacteria bacterium]